MKTRFYWLALLVSAALVGQAQAHGHGGGMGGGMGGAMGGGGRAGPSGGSFSHPMGMHGPGMGYAGRYAAHGMYGMRSSGMRNHLNSQFHNASNLRSGWQNHVFARHSANWHNNWSHNSDHWWHGHHCCFINGSWFVFDLGFYPWWPWPYWYYPYPYYYGYGYPYGGNPYGYGYGPASSDNGGYQRARPYDQYRDNGK